MCAHNRKLESQEGSGCVLTTGSWNHRRVWVCAHNRKLESQEGCECVLRYRKWNHRRDLSVCSQQEAGITGGIGMCSQQEVES